MHLKFKKQRGNAMKKQCGTALELTNGQLAEVAAAIIRELPHIGLDSVTGQGWVGNGHALRNALKKALVPVEAVAVPFKYDKTKDDWTLLENVPFDGKQFVPEIVEFLKPGGLLKSSESYVSGEVMKQRAKELNANLGQSHAEYLLEHQDLVPKEWQGNYYLTFPGTVWQGSGGGRGVPCLHWDGVRWFLVFHWLRGDWSSDVRLVCSRE